MMPSSSSTEAQIKSEIARLTASINLHKSGISSQQGRVVRSNTYVNPNYKPANKYVRPTTNPVTSAPPQPPSTQVKEVVLGGVAFESSGRSLVRKDLPKPASSGPSKSAPPRPNPVYQQQFTRKSGHLIPSARIYKPHSSRGRRGGPSNRNMTLNNSRRPYQTRRISKRLKYSDKPCPRFTTTGSCSRGLTCMYQHDPSKIAICWPFLQGNCTNTAESCNLSHDPIPERTPLCLHFLNKGRCTRDKCPFPHVNVGARVGVCRDFAVLGYCEKGLDCDKQHVRECPDFAEKGTCSTKGCKLPHVIRANRNRKPAGSTETARNTGSSASASSSKPDPGGSVNTGSDESGLQESVTADDAQIGDEYISLTFNESESSEDESDEDEESEDEEGSDPNDYDDDMKPE